MMDPVKGNQTPSRLSAVDITRQRAEQQAAERRRDLEDQRVIRAQLEESNRILYSQAIDKATKQIYAEASKAVKRLEQRSFPNGQNCNAVVSYIARRRLLPRRGAKLFGWFYLQQTEEYTIWHLDINLDNNIFLASNGKVYVESISRRSDVCGEAWSGLHEIDSVDIGIIHQFPYHAQQQDVITDIESKAQQLIKKLRTL